MKFSTKDNDNDKSIVYNCAVENVGTWWYESCHISNLNGIFGNDVPGMGIRWGSKTATTLLPLSWHFSRSLQHWNTY